jgi:hypothetical protein
MLDLIGSSIIAGLLMLTMVRMNANSHETSAFFTEDLAVQENLHQFVRVLESDFRKLGYGDSIVTTASGNIPLGWVIVYASDTAISFLADMNNDRRTDTVFYWLGDTDRVSPNPKDRILWRKLGLVAGPGAEATRHVCSGIISFRLEYYGLGGVKLTENPLPFSRKGQLQVVRITVNLQSPFLTQSQYDADSVGYQRRSALWRESRLIARNYTR